MKKLTIIKVMSKHEALSPSPEELEEWRETFREARNDPDFHMKVCHAVDADEIKVEEIEYYDEDYITLVKVGSDEYKPSFEDLEAWRNIFEQIKDDPDFKIFTHPAVEIQAIPVGKIIAVE